MKEFLVLTCVFSFNSIIILAQGMTINNKSESIHYIGEKNGGGIVFLTFENGKHGLIAAVKNVGRFPFFSGKDASAITKQKDCGSQFAFSYYNGKENTKKLIECCEQILSSRNYAAKACTAYNGYGFNDWYLPSSYQLKALFDNLYVINKILDEDNDPETVPIQFENLYWSSTMVGVVGPCNIMLTLAPFIVIKRVS